MTITTANTAMSVIAALALSIGAAAAEDTDLIENINAEVDAQQEQTFELVAASAELRVAKLSERYSENEDARRSREAFNGS